jgi:molybdenum cofactor biosynthesis protein B
MESVRLYTLTFSDTRTEADDEGGALLRSLLEQAGHRVVGHRIVREGAAEVGAALDEALGLAGVQGVLSTGGTGLAPRDIAAEAASSRMEKELNGFGEAFRRLSWDQVGPRSILSRAVAGSARGRLLVALPGSPKAVRLALEQVLLPVLPHLVALIEGQTSHGCR